MKARALVYCDLPTHSAFGLMTAIDVDRQEGRVWQVSVAQDETTFWGRLDNQLVLEDAGPDCTEALASSLQGLEGYDELMKDEENADGDIETDGVCYSQ